MDKRYTYDINKIRINRSITIKDCTETNTKDDTQTLKRAKAATKLKAKGSKRRKETMINIQIKRLRVCDKIKK